MTSKKNGRQPQTKMEDNLKQKWKTTSKKMVDDLKKWKNGGRPQVQLKKQPQLALT